MFFGALGLQILAAPCGTVVGGVVGGVVGYLGGAAVGKVVDWTNDTWRWAERQVERLSEPPPTGGQSFSLLGIGSR